MQGGISVSAAELAAAEILALEPEPCDDGAGSRSSL
jgi:hypothetical protein